MPYFAQALTQTWSLVLASAVYLVAGFMLAGLIHAFLPAGQIVRWLGRPDWRSVLYAAILGTPLPLCSCSVVPVAAALRRGGASRGATTAFLISTPESGVDSIAITWALLDPLMTIARPVAAMLTALAAGVAENWFGRDEAPAAAAPECGTGDGRTCCDDGSKSACGCAGGSAHADIADSPAPSIHELPRTSLRGRLAAGLRFGLVEMFEDLAVYLVLGFVVAGVLAVLLQAWDPLRAALHSPWAPLLMLAAGIPMYVCASAATPLIAVLVSQGLSPGAGLVFLLAGPATNAASIIVLRRILGRRAVLIYLVTIAVAALVCGALLDATYAGLGITPRALAHVDACAAGTRWVDATFAGLLLLLTANGVWRRYVRPRVTPPSPA